MNIDEANGLCRQGQEEAYAEIPDEHGRNGRLSDVKEENDDFERHFLLADWVVLRDLQRVQFRLVFQCEKGAYVRKSRRQDGRADILYRSGTYRHYCGAYSVML